VQGLTVRPPRDSLPQVGLVYRPTVINSGNLCTHRIVGVPKVHLGMRYNAKSEH